MSILKNIWKSGSKHKKLSDEWDLATNQDCDEDDFCSTGNSTYKVKYLGHIPVDLSKNTEETTAKAIDSIISMSKANRKRVQKVLVSVNLKGIEIVDRSTEKPVFDVSIFRICSCLAYAKFRRVFAFLATDAQEATECHAFLCAKRNVAENLAVTVAQTFSTVYSMWQSSQCDSVGTLYYSSAPTTLPGYSKEDVEAYTKPVTDSLPRSSLSPNKWISFDGSLKDASLASTRCVAFAEVYVSPPAYSEKPFPEPLDAQDWPNSQKSIELIVF